MPGLNRRGPCGEGAMTGRRMGLCNPENRGKTDDEILSTRKSILQPSDEENRGFGRGLGRGFGQGLRSGRGMRRRGNS